MNQNNQEKPVQHIHILGICGTFMGSLAQLAVEKGYRVTGCDANVYPPMSTQLQASGIELIEGFGLDQLQLEPDVFIIGNAMSRGNPLVEAILDKGLSYTSGPEWLSHYVLNDKWVLAIAGTHGKTTTTSMLAWILEYAGMSPGFLIGGVPGNFSCSARLGETPFFVIEADEYDTAFFDKRSKFIHYRPRTLAINNLEFDHADIFENLAAIEKQFHHLVRTVPSNGLLIYPEGIDAIARVLESGCWTPTQTISPAPQVAGDGWSTRLLHDDGSAFEVYQGDVLECRVNWSLIGEHNVHNGLAAILAARHVGVRPSMATEALAVFEGVKRRMECLATINNVSVYDDFAHHPTAIETSLKGLRKKVGKERIIALIEPRSNTMRMGTHQGALAQACSVADVVLWYSPDSLQWNLDAVLKTSVVPCEAFEQLPQVVERALALALDNKNDAVHLLVMSNGSFGGIHQQLIDGLQSKS